MVRTGVPLASVPWPPTRRSFGWPAPLAPWHAWHFCSNTAAPVTAVPRPGGSPTPSGPTLISQPAICSGFASTPRFGVTGAGLASLATLAVGPAAIVVQALNMSASATPHSRSRVDMLDLAVGRDAPRLNPVEVEDRVRAVLRDERRAL